MFVIIIDSSFHPSSFIFSSFILHLLLFILHPSSFTFHHSSSFVGVCTLDTKLFDLWHFSVLIILKKHFSFVLCLFDAMQSKKVAEKRKKTGVATVIRHHTCAFIEQTFIPLGVRSVTLPKWCVTSSKRANLIGFKCKINDFLRRKETIWLFFCNFALGSAKIFNLRINMLQYRNEEKSHHFHLRAKIKNY